MKKEDYKKIVQEKYGISEEYWQEAKGVCLNSLDECIEMLKYFRGKIAQNSFIEEGELKLFGSKFFDGEVLQVEENGEQFVDCLNLFILEDGLEIDDQR